MKYLYKILLIISMSIFSLGCSDFLDLPAKNERAVQSLDDIKSILAGYLYGQSGSMKTSIVGLSPLFTSDMLCMFEGYSDNIDANVAVPNNYLVTGNYTPESKYANTFLWNNFTTPSTIWIEYYEVIGFLNTLIYEMDNISYNDQDEWNRVMGEMLTHRAYYFFKLLQYFAPYDKEQVGIPVYLHTGEDVVGVRMPRKTHTEVYSTIINDLLRAEELFLKTEPRESFNLFWIPNRFYHIFSQVYWYKAESIAKEASDYQLLVQYTKRASHAVEESIPETRADLLLARQGRDGSYPGLYINDRMMQGAGWLFGSPYASWGIKPGNIPVTPDFASIFDVNDIRDSAYFSAPGIILPTMFNDGHAILFRPEEALLMLSEALYHTGGDATEPLNILRKKRNLPEITGLTGESLLQEIKTERRRELFGDTDKRWLDLKRYGGVSIDRRITFFEKVYTISVKPGAYQYSLPIPVEEILENKEIVQNEGWVEIEF